MINLCIIPARGGSKRIPHKNVKPFMGKPILAYSIENALATGLFDEVMVSTDDPEIIEVAKQYGASVPFIRTEKTANDFATLADVLHEVLEMYEDHGQHFDNMCCLLATCPLVKPSYISDAYEKLIKSNFISTYPIVQFSYPILRSLKMGKEGEVSMNWPEYARTRSQDLAPAYHDSGTFYWHKVNPWLKGERRNAGIVISEDLVQDIDTEEDWRMAEMKYIILNGKA